MHPSTNLPPENQNNPLAKARQKHMKVLWQHGSINWVEASTLLEMPLHQAGKLLK